MADSFPSEDADLLKDRRNRNILEKRKKKIKERKYRKSHTQTVEEVVARYATLNEENASSWTKFSDFPLSQKTLRGLRDNKFLTPTEIQSQSLGFSLKGNDVVGAAKTGSGKTLALIIPVRYAI
jgi:ATP-dependent RNA helicase DDX10/DBP4